MKNISNCSCYVTLALCTACVSCSSDTAGRPDLQVAADSAVQQQGAMPGRGSGDTSGGPSFAGSESAEQPGAGLGSIEEAPGEGAMLMMPLSPAESDQGGAQAEDPLPSLIGEVAFSTPSQAFQGELLVTMAVSQPAAAASALEIRYTTDGELPTADSLLYDGELSIVDTTQLRAQAFAGGEAVGLPSTALYIARTFDASSDIPLIIMEGYGAGKPPEDDKETFLDLAFMLFEPSEGEAALSSLPTLATRAGYHIRGQSSAGFDKAPYRVELWDNDDQDADYPMIGMAPEADWAMIGPFSDKTLVRNAFVYSLASEMGLEAMQLQFAEVYINQDEGPLDAADYQGVYAVTQTIKNQKSRVDLKQLRPEDTLPGDVTGGYIFKFDQAAVDDGELELICTGSPPMRGGFGQQQGGGGTCWDDLELVDPAPANPEQSTWITGHLQEFHDALHASPIGDGYLRYIDLRSFVDHFIISEITRDVDAYIRSHYMHKDRDGLIKAGPVWDYNFALNNFGDEIEGWQWQEGRTGTNDWYDILPSQPLFMEAVSTRFSELRETLLADSEIDARIDAVRAPLQNAGPRDLQRWPVGVGRFGGGGGDDSPPTWEGQIEDLKAWTHERLAWLDTQLR